MTPEPLTCVASISAERLSRWRDGGLAVNEAQHMREHTADCPACRERLAGFERVAETLRGQRELDPNGRVWDGVRQRVERAPARFSPVLAGHVLRGLAGVAAVLALAALFASVLGGHLGHGAIGQTSESVKTITSPGPLGTRTVTVYPGNLEIMDATAAQNLTYAYVLDNDVWVGVQGKEPFQATHLGLGTNHLIWTIAWAQDHTMLLANETADVDATTARAWLIYLSPSLSVNEVPPGSPLVRGCANYFNCLWVGHRYVVHVDRSIPTNRYHYFRIYDVKAVADTTSSDIISPLDGQHIYQMEVRGNLVFYTAFGGANSPVNRIAVADPANPAFQSTIVSPEPFSAEVDVVGGWDLSADGTRAVAWPLHQAGGTTACASAPNCVSYFSAGGGAATNIFTQSHAPGPVVISPDGSHAAALATGGISTLQIVRQPLPTGTEDANAVPDASLGHADGLIGWSADSRMVFERQEGEDRQGNRTSTRVYGFAPEGTQTSTLVLTLYDGATLFIAPNY